MADEVHRYGADQFQYALLANYRRRLGLTATLERSGDDAVEEVLSHRVGLPYNAHDRLLEAEELYPMLVYKLRDLPMTCGVGEIA